MELEGVASDGAGGGGSGSDAEESWSGDGDTDTLSGMAYSFLEAISFSSLPVARVPTLSAAVLVSSKILLQDIAFLDLHPVLSCVGNN